MSGPAPEESRQALPLALAALDVAGQIRERNPADLAIFGENSGRLLDRFADRAAGQELLARAVANGSVEGDGLLATAAGMRRFRVSLWRQRGGERIRVLAVFASPPPSALGADLLQVPARRAFARAGGDLRSPIDAVIRLADAIRSGAGAAAPDIAARAESILAAAWRLMRVAADLDAAAASGASGPVLFPSEVDVGRLARRVAALAAPAAAGAGIEIETAGLPPPGSGPVVLTDEGALWSAWDLLVRHASRLGAPGAQVAVSVVTDAGGAALAVSLRGQAPDEGAATRPGPSENTDLDTCRDLALAIGASLEIGAGPGFAARLLFPAARCLRQA